MCFAFLQCFRKLRHSFGHDPSTEQNEPVRKAPIKLPTSEPETDAPVKRYQPPPREPSPEPVREPSPVPQKERSPDPWEDEPSPEPQREPSPEPQREPSPEPESYNAPASPISPAPAQSSSLMKQSMPRRPPSDSEEEDDQNWDGNVFSQLSPLFAYF